MKPYERWEGKIYVEDGAAFIETDDEEWGARLYIWMKHKDDPLCPMPMPKNHLLFQNKSHRFITIKELLSKEEVC